MVAELPASAPSRAGLSTGDRYHALFPIGQGGMGSVVVALERGGGGYQRVVALKRLLPEGARDPRHKEMFLREARLAALLFHPNVVHAFDFGELGGEFFLAMEYVEGEPLSRVVEVARQKEGGLVPAIVAYLLAQVCDGLHAAHELRGEGGAPLNVVHRDLSPHNVMVAHEGHVKLLDFGVAKFDLAGGGVTRTGEVKGKMAYMSPEQAMGDRLDRRSDLFSLGAVLYECLTGQRMWGGGTDLEIMRKLALEQPPALSGPPALASLHARLVARNPAERPPTALAVAQELRTFIASTGTRPDARVMGAVMRRLFADDAARQRRALNEAIEAIAPARVAELRRTLGNLPRVDPSQAPPPSREATRSRGWIAWAAVFGVVGLGGVATGTALALRRGTGERPDAGIVPSAAPTPGPTASASPTPDPADARPDDRPAPSAAASPPTSPRSGGTAPAPSGRPASPRDASPPTTSKPPPPRPPDVDPDPL